MKRKVFMMILSTILMFIFVSCSFKEDNSLFSSNNPVEEQENYSDIIIQSPMTLSNNDLFHINGKHQYLRLKMIKGKYYEDWNLGTYMGTIWEGYYIIELVDEYDNTTANIDLSKIYAEPLVFNSSFEILFDDYNDDGDIDFTIGQYASNNGNDYKLFTIKKEGQIEELTIRDYPTLFISNTTGYYSTKLTKIDDISFKKEYYENSKGKYFEDVFRWDGKEFFKDGSY